MAISNIPQIPPPPPPLPPSRKEFNIQVLQEFVRMHKFHGLDLVNALRAFLGSFQLPGEAQKIDRMMESFAQRYCQCNPGMFSNTGKYNFYQSNLQWMVKEKICMYSPCPFKVWSA